MYVVVARLACNCLAFSDDLYLSAPEQRFCFLNIEVRVATKLISIQGKNITCIFFYLETTEALRCLVLCIPKKPSNWIENGLRFSFSVVLMYKG